MRNSLRAGLMCLVSSSLFVLGCSPTNSQEGKQPKDYMLNATCLICEDLHTLEASSETANVDEIFIDGVKGYFAEVRADRQYSQPLPIRFSVHGFCESQDAQELISLQNNYIGEFEKISERIQSCTEACNIKLNDADYCAMGSMLSFNQKDWGDISAAFQSAAFLLQDADINQRTTAMEANILMQGTLAASRASLRASFVGQFGEPMRESINTEHELAMRELYDLGIGLQALHWAGLSGDNGQKLGSTLIWLSKEIAAIEADTYSATTRAKLLEPKDRLDLVKRTIRATALLSLVKQSLARSADLSQLPTRPNTQGNANPSSSSNSIEIKAAASCFTRLSIETSIVPEFSKIVGTELEMCRPFIGCPVFKNENRNFSTKIDRALSIYSKDEKVMLSVRNAVCK